MSPLEYLRSAYRISVSESDTRFLLDILVANDIPFHDLRTEDGMFSLLLYMPYYKEYARLRGERRYRKETREQLGFRALLHRYRKRKGILVGFVLAIFLIVFSSLFVWDITVTGADTIPEAVILDALEKRGVKLGTFVPSVDTEAIEQVMILDVEGLSYVSINLRGTVASVEVRERKQDTEIEDRQTPSNLIATADGQIEALQVTGGVSVVKPGDIVRKGELLVSGVIDSQALGYRLVRARGEVFARVTLSYQTQIPYETEEKVYTGEFFSQKSIKIFSKTIKLFGKDSISPSTCDKIEMERRIYLFGFIKLPIFIMETKYAEYELVLKTLTQTEALRMAYDDIRAQSENILDDAEILGRHTRITEDENTLCMTQQIECIINIAEEVKIETD
ncbi:MAG: sporulation protein YqfD [Clostridia bacterium]|nr:sporulation protein YqfD [Clostridia bacterium]